MIGCCFAYISSIASLHNFSSFDDRNIKTVKISLIILLNHILGRREVWREREQNGSCCCSWIISHWLIVVWKESASTEDVTLLVSFNDPRDEKLLATPVMSSTLATTFTATTTATGRECSCWCSTPVYYSNLFVTPVLSFPKVHCLHRHHCCDISWRL